jgi:hypothetical protein
VIKFKTLAIAAAISAGIVLAAPVASQATPRAGSIQFGAGTSHVEQVHSRKYRYRRYGHRNYGYRRYGHWNGYRRYGHWNGYRRYRYNDYYYPYYGYYPHYGYYPYYGRPWFGPGIGLYFSF